MNRVSELSKGLVEDLKQGVVSLLPKNHPTWSDIKAKFFRTTETAHEIESVEYAPGIVKIDDQEVELKNIEAIQLRHELKGRPWDIVDVFMIVSSPSAKTRFGIRDPELRNFGTLSQNSWLGRDLLKFANEQKIPLYEA